MTSPNAHAALIVNNVVQQVIVIPYCNDDDDEITAYCNNLGLAGQWLDTSYLGSRRGKYAAVGDIWNGSEFVSPQQTIDNE